MKLGFLGWNVRRWQEGTTVVTRELIQNQSHAKWHTDFQKL